MRTSKKRPGKPGRRALTEDARRRRDASLFRSLDELPVTLVVDDIISVYRRSRTTILREVRAGIFQPPPFDARPYRWRKEDVLRDLDQKAAAAERDSRRKVVGALRALTP
jgi:hypothetical protein